ncbi:DNA-binding protein [Candidatus Micrarchaeota archaeon]|nr:DNA-binding protein [Candidatus Micrarchaeota archaeon]
MERGRPVILDTNFLLIPYQFKINIVVEIERLLERAHYFVISSRTVAELEHISKTRNKDGRAATLALKTIEANKKNIEIIQSTQEVDDWIYENAEKMHAVVCTNDAQLRRRLKGQKIISLKGKTRLGTI